jgi:ABC-type glycerol-3-phosphate transport system substrate-binding protein
VAYRQDRLWIDPVSTVGSFRQLMDLRGEFGGEELVYLGMPSDGGGIPSLNAANTFSITADSPVKDGAWAFIRHILADEMIHYASPNQYLPVTRSNFEKQTELERRYFYFYPLDGTSGSWMAWDGETVPEYDRTRQIGLGITDEDVQFVLDLLTKRTLYPLVTTSYKTINSLINEELSAFFAGNVTAEDAARRIQSRVSIYLAEQS